VKTRALVAKISAACHSYYNDWHAYPGLLDENNVAGAASPSSTIGVTPTSSENLVLSLLGGVSIATGQFDINLVKSGPQNLNPADPKQYPAYLDVQAGELSTDIGMGQLGGDTAIPEFMDAYPDPKPIIYLRARTGAKGIVDDNSDVRGQNDPQYMKEKMVIYATDAQRTQSLGGTWPPNTQKFTPYASWYDYLRNPGLMPSDATQAPATEVPRGRDAFILISAGTDRAWGTTDDIFSGE
jgi:hypothetical protein